MSRLGAGERVERLLAIIPFVAAAPDGVDVDELCARFDVDRRQLVRDLELAQFVGVGPATPDTMIDVIVEDGRVFVHLPQWFDRPLRLTPEQALALVLAGRGLLAVQGSDPSGPLARGLDKLAGALGARLDETVDVALGDARPDVVARVERAIAERRRMRFGYYSYGRDEHRIRTVDPWRLWADAGQWYLAGWCHDADAERIFRLDRVDELELLDDAASPPGQPAAFALFQASADDPRVTLELSASARWVAETYPTEEVTELGDGRLAVRLAVTARPWLERLLLRLGSEAQVADSPPELADAARTAARRVLARYRDPQQR